MKNAVLETAFRATTYRVETPTEGFDLAIDSPHAGFARFLQALDCREWGVITAHNPGARQDGDAEENAARNAALAVYSNLEMSLKGRDFTSRIMLLR
ncbi:MAG: hypothetical protein LBL72_11010 [Candidatus Accumulibacter sp.]|jgi:hypothetical protein|nr:hypothetical protein [Accumulibacter sp.]